MGSRVLAVSVAFLVGLPQGEAIANQLVRPAYPPIALSARVSGEVEVEVGVRPNGRVESAAVVRGAPPLQAAALEAAKQSRFDCRGCAGASVPYRLVFAFQLDGAGAASPDRPGDAANDAPGRSRIVIVGEVPPIILDNVSRVEHRVRSARCLWLWRCASKEVPPDRQ